ncbi:hypothetical protein ES705_06276 [subsurface metagenome]
MRNLKVGPGFFGWAENFIEDIPEEMVEISIRTYSFFGIKYKDEMVFKCKVCNQVLHPQFDSEGRTVRSAWQCPNGCKLKDLEIMKGD